MDAHDSGKGSDGHISMFSPDFEICPEEKACVRIFILDWDDQGAKLDNQDQETELPSQNIFTPRQSRR